MSISKSDFIKFIAPYAVEDMAANGVLASVTIAQAILESSYGNSELALNANNYFGMKCSLSGNTWSGSTWDGESTYTKRTTEQNEDGTEYTVTAEFRKYASAAESVGDHSAYLLGAKNGSAKRYAGLQGETDPETAITIIKNGGYATDVNYISKVMNIITENDLTQYDTVEQEATETMSLNIIQNSNFGTHNTSKRSGDIEYIVIHYVGGVSTAKNNVDYFNKTSTTNASADFFVGHEGEIYQYNPEPKSRYCWAVGGAKQSSYGGSLYGIAKNANCVNVEMCVRTKGGTAANSADWYFEDATVENAVALTKYLMNLYGIDADHVIRHFDVNGKLCPGVVGWNAASGSETAWTAFKKKISATDSGSSASSGSGSAASGSTSEKKYYRVRTAWSDAATQKGAFTSLENAKACADENAGYYVFDWDGNLVYTGANTSTSYKVKVDIDDLRIRKGAGTNYGYWTKNGKTVYTGKGTFTIVKEADGKGATKWGLLKSYEENENGWISLDYVTKL